MSSMISNSKSISHKNTSGVKITSMTNLSLFCPAATHGSEKCVSVHKYNFVIISACHC